MQINKFFCCFLLFGSVFFSCKFDTEAQNYYFKAFFLGDIAFVAEGEVFRDMDLKTPHDFTSIAAKIYDLEEWEIEGKKTGTNTFSLPVNINANSIILSKETIDIPKSIVINWLGFPDNFPAYEMIFYVDGKKSYDKFHKKGEDRHSMYFIYVGAPIDLSWYDPDDEPKDWFWQYRNPKHYDLNFNKPGWYKIVKNNESMKDNSVYASAKNTFISTFNSF